jgi:hypothetical protein
MKFLCRLGLHKWQPDSSALELLAGVTRSVCDRCGRRKVHSGEMMPTSGTPTTWPRNRSTDPGGGLSTDRGGGLYTGPGGGASTGPGGGLYTGPGGGRSTRPGGGLSTRPGGGLYSGPGGGLSTGPRGGLSTGPGGGLSSGPGGGLSTSSANSYRSNQPPMDVLIPYLRSIGQNSIADKLAQAHKLNL